MCEMENVFSGYQPTTACVVETRLVREVEDVGWYMVVGGYLQSPYENGRGERFGATTTNTVKSNNASSYSS
jgi:hypothetical protein